MNQNELIDFIKEQGYENVRELDDGTIVGTLYLMYTKAIFIGLNRHGYEKRFCFNDAKLADSEINLLKSSDDEPNGYIAKRTG
jgi:hypothetical protein